MGAVGPQRVAFPADGTLPEMPPRLVAERVVLARLHRPRVRRPGRHRLQPHHRAREAGRRRQGRRQAGRRDRPEGVLRIQARPRVALRVHGPLALGQRPLGLTGPHRRRELRRVPGRSARAHAPGERRDRPERRDPHLPGARDHGARPDATTTSSAGSTATDDGRRGPASRTLAGVPDRYVARTSRSARPRRSRPATTRLPDARRLDAGGRARPDPGATRRPPRAPGRSRDARRGPRQIRTFVRELLRDERKVLGLYDTTITATDPFPDRDAFAGPDPTLSGISPAYTTAINRHAAHRDRRRHRPRVRAPRARGQPGVEERRRARTSSSRRAGATDDFRYGMSLNPHMKAFITHGRYDLVTPYYASDRLRNLMRLDPADGRPADGPALRRRTHVLRVGVEPEGVHGRDRGVRARRDVARRTWPRRRRRAASERAAATSPRSARAGVAGLFQSATGGR